MTSSSGPASPDHASSGDHLLARELADRAGELLLALRPGLLARLEPDAAGRAADAAAQDLLAQALADHRPGDAVLSEEAADDLARLDASRVWIVDPLDGTREYVREDRTDWAVHVALWTTGLPAGTACAAGAVSLPALGVTLSSDVPPVLPPRPVRGGPVRIVVSRSRPPALMGPLAERLAIEVRPHGSAGAKAAEVLLGRADAYLHDSALNQWDAAAPVAVAQAAGLHVSRLDGSPVAFNLASPVSGDLLICRREVAEDLLAGLAPLVAAP